MKSNINRIGLGFLIAFFVISGGLLAYDVFFVWPIKACEEHGHWWDEQDRICAVPVPLSVITGRHIGAAPKPVAPQVVTPPAAKPAAHTNGR
jgi:hypothetical protein